jgi:hypothetical protein
LPGEQQAAGIGPRADPDGGHLGIAGDLPAFGTPPELRASLVHIAIAMQPAGGELAAVGIDR